jgi:mRNA interferase MazF
MTTLRAGEIWIAEITFTDGSASKKRPVLILWLDGADAVVCAVTSAAPRTRTDVALRDWQVAGLRVPSTARLSRLDCVEQSLLIARLGSLSTGDASQLKGVWAAEVSPAF